MYSKILVPLDGSETAACGLREAILLAKNQRSRIGLVHILNELINGLPDANINIGQMLELLLDGAHSILADGEAAVRNAGIEVETKLVEAMGNAAGEHIIQYATEWGADLIVCGTHGRRGIRRIVFGSDAEYIVRHTPVPILLIRSQGLNTT